MRSYSLLWHDTANVILETSAEEADDSEKEIYK